MSGVEIIGGLLRAFEPLAELVAAASVKAGKLPDGVILPALLIRSVSVTDRQRLSRAPLRRSTERVSVAVRAANYRDQKEVIRLVRQCCADRTGDFAGCFRVSILTAGTGPDVGGPANSFEQTQDFRVSFDAAA